VWFNDPCRHALYAAPGAIEHDQPIHIPLGAPGLGGVLLTQFPCSESEPFLWKKELILQPGIMSLCAKIFTWKYPPENDGSPLQLPSVPQQISDHDIIGAPPLSLLQIREASSARFPKIGRKFSTEQGPEVSIEQLPPTPLGNGMAQFTT